MLKVVRRQHGRGEMVCSKRNDGGGAGGGGEIEHHVSSDAAEAHLGRGGGMPPVRGRFRVNAQSASFCCRWG